MGISTNSRLIVGYTFDQLTEIADAKDLEIEDLTDELDRASPYYDADRDDCIFGESVVSGYGSYAEVSTADLIKAGAATEKLRQRFDVEPKLYVSANVT